MNNIMDDLSDDDQEIVEFVEYERRPHVIRERENHFEELDQQDFFVRYRLRQETVLSILEQIEAQLETVTDRNHSIPPITQLLLTLRFYATGNFLLTVADTMKVSKSSACKIVKKVSVVIARLAPAYIRLPTEENELTEAKIKFYAKAALPRIIGSVDCTHVKIQSPGGNNAELFRNRKGYFSINVQTVSSADLKILDIVARWPGSAHDQTIFNNSAVKARLDNNVFGNSLLVADSGYANSMHVITPLVEPRTEVQQLYNEAVTRTRNPVERQYGVWKRRFPVLALGIRLKLETTLAVIVATAVLHNIAIDQNEEEPPQDPAVDMQNINFDEDFHLLQNEDNNHLNARDFLLEEYIPRLLA